MCDSTRGRVIKRPVRLRRCASDESATLTEVKGQVNHGASERFSRSSRQLSGLQ